MRLCLLLVALAAGVYPLASFAEEESETQRVVVNGNGGRHDDALEEEGGYGQPEWVDRSRVSVTTRVYVLNPFEMFVGLRSETDVLRRGRAVADLRQEFEIGLPYRFELDVENQVSFARRRAAETGPNLGVRYAFANWNKIPFNPAIEASYQFGTGSHLADRFEQTGRRGKSDGYEVRALLGQGITTQLRWSANAFFEHDLGANHERQAGFTQNVSYLVIPDRLEAGVEMRYTNATLHGEKGTMANEFALGPSVSYTPRTATFLGVTTLFGCTGDSPKIVVLASVALEFGSGEGKSTLGPGDR